MVIFHSYVSLPEGKPPFSYGFPMVFPLKPPFSSHHRTKPGKVCFSAIVAYCPSSLRRWAPKSGTPIAGWFIMEHLIKMDDFGVPPF